MEISFSGKNVLVTGASRGIGRSIALGFADCGANVSICARGPEALRKTEGELKSKGHKVHAATCDLANAAAVTQYVKDAAAALGGIDVLVNNASGFGGRDDEEGWRVSVDVDLMASVRASHAALPFLERAGGSIIHISSIAGLRSSVRFPPYGAVKAALIQYTRNQAARFAAKKIRVNCIVPGWIMTQRQIDLWLTPEAEENLMQAQCIKRKLYPDDVARLVMFLASDDSSGCTNQSYVIDGGRN